MKQMGISQSEIDASRVVIEKTDGSSIIIEDHQVLQVNMSGQQTFQVSGNIKEIDAVEKSDLLKDSKDAIIDALSETYEKIDNYEFETELFDNLYNSSRYLLVFSNEIKFIFEKQSALLEYSIVFKHIVGRLSIIPEGYTGIIDLFLIVDCNFLVGNDFWVDTRLSIFLRVKCLVAFVYDKAGISLIKPVVLS